GKQFKSHHGRYRIPRQAEKIFLVWRGHSCPRVGSDLTVSVGESARATRAEDDRPPRPDLRSRKIKLRLQLPENLLHQIVLPHGDAARQQQKIALQSFPDPSFFDQCSQPAPLIRSDPEPHRLPAGILNLRRQRIGIRIPYLRRPGVASISTTSSPVE